MLLTVRDTAKRLNVSRNCVYQLVDACKLPCHRISLGRGAIRISEDDIRQHLESCRYEKCEEPRRTPRPKLKHLKL